MRSHSRAVQTSVSARWATQCAQLRALSKAHSPERSNAANNTTNDDMSNDRRCAASTTADRNDDDEGEDNTALDMATPTAPPLGGIGLFRSGHHAGPQALALAA